MKSVQKRFQRAKRHHWCSEQEDMLAGCEQNQQQLWRKIGQIGIGQERSRAIPLKDIKDNGSVCKGRLTILNKWQTHFQNLLNADSTTNTVPETELPQYQEPINGLRELNKNISLGDVIKALQQAKFGKAIGIDGLPVEVLKEPCVCKLSSTCIIVQ